MDVRFTDRELDIIEVLWKHGPSTVAEVRVALEDDLAYNTVRTRLSVRDVKAHGQRERRGRAHRYRRPVERADASRSALERLTERLFGGSASAVMLELVGRGGLDDDELRRMRDLLDEQLRRAKGS